MSEICPSYENCVSMWHLSWKEAGIRICLHFGPQFSQPSVLLHLYLFPSSPRWMPWILWKHQPCRSSMDRGLRPGLGLVLAQKMPLRSYSAPGQDRVKVPGAPPVQQGRNSPQRHFAAGHRTWTRAPGTGEASAPSVSHMARRSLVSPRCAQNTALWSWELTPP